MTEEKFTEYVNLYLDKEISDRGLVELKAELESNPERKEEFRERCRLHQAMRLALNPGAAASRRDSSPVRRRAGTRTNSSAGSRANSRGGVERAPRVVPSREASSGSTRVGEFADQHVVFPRWIAGAGLAACLALGFVLLTPVFRDTTSVASQPVLEGVNGDELVEEDPLDQIGRHELRRFASIQAQRAENQRASIAAQLRLMGLRPELTPEEKQLRRVSMASIQPSLSSRNDAAFIQEVQKLTPMPAQQILRHDSHVESSARWPGGFHSSLASFK